jgi:protein tyrosine/serine phosphatase
MKKWMFSLAAILLLSAPGFAADARLRPQSWATPVLSENLHNWYQVDQLVYRSEQPDAEAMAEVEKFGIRRVLTLREYHDDEDETKASGLQIFRIPMNAAKIETKDVVQALKIIKASDEPILVHCWHGSDRTGTVIAMYRIVEQGWSKEAAIDELKNGGYGYHSIYGNIIDFINNADIDNLKKQIEE